MLSLQRLFQALSIKKKMIVKAVAVLSIASLVVANVLPELSSSLPSMADDSGIMAQAPTAPPSTRYIYVDEDGSNLVFDSSHTCHIYPAGTPYPSTVQHCNLNLAIFTMDTDTINTPLTIVIADSLTTLHLTNNLASLHHVSNPTVAIVLDGIKTNGTKTILVDNTPGHNTLDYFFQIGATAQSNPAAQNITIKNFAFTQLHKIGSAAITSDQPGTSGLIDGAAIEQLNINNNFFGTTDGSTLNADNYIWGGIQMFLSAYTLSPELYDSRQIHINENNFYNTVLPIQMGNVTSGTNCVGTTEADNAAHITTEIYYNTIGSATNAAIDTGYAGEGAWSYAAINICNMGRLDINNNFIFNSSGLLSDTAILLTNTQHRVRDNIIGGYSTFTTAAHAIFGYGIHVKGIYNAAQHASASSVADSYIVNNQIGNIHHLINPDAIAVACTGRYNLGASGKSCGGTAVLLENTKRNFVYSNFIGNLVLPNDGYGIEIEGSATRTGSDVSYQASSDNKIFGNTIFNNTADGIHVATIDGGSEAPSCTATVLPGNVTSSNNCNNTIIQNSIFRNGSFNGLTFGSISPSHEGGIGIDLKTTTDTTEQKYGTTQLHTGSGSANDSDITLNDTTGTVDADLGGNEALNFPIINAAGDTATGSSIYEIKGNLSENENGKYWVEVSAVLCEPGSFVPEDAIYHCDTDTFDEGTLKDGHLYGQGAAFLCGAFVNKTATVGSSSWSCKPSDFGTAAFRSGLVTATVTKLPTSITRTAYSDTTPPNPLPPFFAERAGGNFSCELANEFLSNLGAICGSGVNYKAKVDLNYYEYAILSGLGSTSEFSQDVYLPQAQITVAKEVRTCSSASTSSCTGNFSSTVTAHPGDYVEFRIDALNTTDTSIRPTISDSFPAGLTPIASTCQSFFDQATLTNTRPTTNNVNCSGYVSGQNLGYSPNSSSASDAGNRSVLYILARVNSDVSVPSSLVNTAHATDLAVCDSLTDIDCASTATVNVQANQRVTVLKEIVSPDTDSPVNTRSETVTSGNAAIPVTYQITLNMEGVSASDVANFGLEDTITDTIRLNYASANCQYRTSVDGGTQSAPRSCTNANRIGENGNPLVIWSGSNFASDFASMGGINHRETVVIRYTVLVPANAIPSTGRATTVVNRARWNGQNTPESSASLTVNPAPAQRPSTVTLSKTVSPATITSSASPQTVTYTVTLVKAAGDTLSNFTWTDTYPTTPVALTYSNCNVAVTGGSASGITCTSPFPDTSSSHKLLNTGTIGSGITSVVVTYTATVPANAVTTTQTIRNDTAFSANSGTVNGTGQATLTVNPAQTQNPQTGSVSITKKLDTNLVVGTDRHAEKIFKPGDLLSYTVTLRNTGNSAASNASLRDTLSGNINTIAIDSTPTGTSGTVSGQVISVPTITIPSGGSGVSVRYHGNVVSKNDFNLDDFNLNESTNPARDDDFYIPKDTDPDGDITSTSNSHRKLKDITGAPDGKFVSLGKDGSIIVDLGDKVVVDSSGNDFSVLELDQSAIDDNDKTTESYDVSVSQDGETFKAITADNTDTDSFDLKKANLTWARYIKLEDSSSTVKAQAPGADIDAVCLLHIGVQVPNSAELTYNGQTYRASENAVVDVTNVFKKKPSTSNCEEPEPVVVTPTPAPLPPPPAPPAPVVVPPKPPSLPKTGPEAVGILGLLATVATVIVRRRKNK